MLVLCSFSFYFKVMTPPLTKLPPPPPPHTKLKISEPPSKDFSKISEGVGVGGGCMPCVRASLNPLYVILFDVFKHLLLRKTDIFKTCWKSKFIKKKIWNALALKSKKIATKYIRENVYFGIIIFSCLSSTKLCLRFLLNCFAREIIKTFIRVP